MSPASYFDNAAVQVGFIKNNGQVIDFNNKPVEFVLYQANLGGQQVFITKYGLSILLSRPKKIVRTASNTTSGLSSKDLTPADSITIVDYEMERIDIVLKDADIQLEKIQSKKKEGSPSFNFYTAENSPDTKPIFLQSEVLVKNVYPGIDWKVYIENDTSNSKKNLKYDFIVHPGADVSQIKARYSANTNVELVNNEIKATSKMGSIHEKQPYSYLKTNKMQVDVKYTLSNNTIGFKATDYNTNDTLIIDPSVFWLTYLSSSLQNIQQLEIFGNDVETDAVGNVFVQLSARAGTPFPTLNPGGGAYYQTVTASPNGSMIISKFAPGGQMLWSTYFGNGVNGRTMSVDKFGNIVTVGSILDGTPSVPNPNPSIPLLNNGGFYDQNIKKYFIAKFTNSGELVWSSYFANFSTSPMDMTYDTFGNFYVVGWSEVPQFPTANPGGGAYFVSSPQFGAAQVLFISQFNSSNNLVWSTRIEGNDYDPSARVCTDKVGNIYIAGHARSTNYPMVNAGGYFNPTAWGAVITRFNANRQMTWSTYLPTPFVLDDLTVDDSCNLYVVAAKKIIKFDSSTNMVFDKSVNIAKMHFWKRIHYDPVTDQIQLLGIMNDSYFGFSTINSACNGSFYFSGQPQNYLSATGPIFATIDHDGEFSYRSLVDWPAEYYQYFEMTTDNQGNMLYIFGHNRNGYTFPNPQLTDPGNGAYFDSHCCYLNTGGSALLLKLNPSALNVFTQITPVSGCNCDGQVTAIPQCGTAPYTYLWSNGATSPAVTGLCPGNYWVKVTDANNISVTKQFIIQLPLGSINSISPLVIPENCNRSNGSIQIQSVQGGLPPYSYSLDGLSYVNTSQFIGLSSGDYYVRVKDANGCVFTDTVTISSVSAPTAVQKLIKKSSCAAEDGTIKITNVENGAGPFLYTLVGIGTNSTGFFTNLAPSSYQIIVTDTAGCIFSETVNIEQESPPTDVTVVVSADHCNQHIGSINIVNVAGGTSPFTYSTDSVTFVPGILNSLTAGVYSLYVKDVNGCVLKKTPIIIENEESPSSAAIFTVDAYCGRLTGSVEVQSVIGGYPPYFYSINGSNYFTTASFNEIPPGSNTIYIKDSYGCVLTKNYTIDFKLLPDVGLHPKDTIVCYDQNLSLTVTGETNLLNSITWNIPSQGLFANFKASGSKDVIVTMLDKNNCRFSDTTSIQVKACNPPEKCLFVPSAFTPNNDGLNDKIYPLTTGCRLQKLNFSIYSRWGELIFETTTIGSGWDGTYKGVKQNGNIYVYSCQYTTEDGIARKIDGTFVLIR